MNADDCKSVNPSICLPPDIERRLRDYTLAMESETYAEYLMKRDLEGIDGEEGPIYENEEEFNDAHRSISIRVFPSCTKTSKSIPQVPLKHASARKHLNDEERTRKPKTLQTKHGTTGV